MDEENAAIKICIQKDYLYFIESSLHHKGDVKEVAKAASEKKKNSRLYTDLWASKDITESEIKSSLI